MTNGEAHDRSKLSVAASAGERVSDRTVFGSDSRITAAVIGDEIILQGSFRGDVSGRAIRVASAADVDARVTCEVAEILGRFEGTLEAKAARFGSSAVAHGAFQVDRLTIEEGAIVSGSFNLGVVDRNPRAVALPGQTVEQTSGSVEAAREISPIAPDQAPA